MTHPTADSVAHPKLRVLVFAASLRADSLNTKLAKLAATVHGMLLSASKRPSTTHA
jgi:hypothetical protein